MEEQARGRAGLGRALTERLEPSLRRVLHLYWRLARGLTLGVRGAAFDGMGRVCLVRHTYTPGWHLPGGGVEPGETAAAALGRELLEEAELVLGPTEPRLHGVFFNRGVSRRDHVLVYVVEDFSVERLKIPDREIEAAAFFPVDALPSETTGATRRRIAEMRDGRPLDHLW